MAPASKMRLAAWLLALPVVGNAECPDAPYFKEFELEIFKNGEKVTQAPLVQYSVNLGSHHTSFDAPSQNQSGNFKLIQEEPFDAFTAKNLDIRVYISGHALIGPTHCAPDLDTCRVTYRFQALPGNRLEYELETNDNVQAHLAIKEGPSISSEVNCQATISPEPFKHPLHERYYLDAANEDEVVAVFTIRDTEYIRKLPHVGEIQSELILGYEDGRPYFEKPSTDGFRIFTIGSTTSTNPELRAYHKTVLQRSKIILRPFRTEP